LLNRFWNTSRHVLSLGLRVYRLADPNCWFARPTIPLPIIRGQQHSDGVDGKYRDPSSNLKQYRPIGGKWQFMPVAKVKGKPNRFELQN